MEKMTRYSCGARRRFSAFARPFTATVLALLGSAALSSAQILSFDFNDSGSTTANSGSLGGSGTFYNGSNTQADLHSSAGGGVSGQSGDLSFNNTASTGMGFSSNPSNSGGRVQLDNASIVSAIDGLTSFTITGWFKTDGSKIGNNAQLVSLGFKSNISTASYSGISVRSPGGLNGRLTVQFQGENGNFSVSTPSSTFLDQDTWVFFALTYDSTVTSGNTVAVYYGTSALAAVSVYTFTTNVGAISATTSGTTSAIGNAGGSTSAPFDGDMDDITLYGSALTLSQIDAIRLANLAPVPEPATLALVTASLGFALLVVRRRA